jgi:ligand-binding sensor domain-containing protein
MTGVLATRRREAATALHAGVAMALVVSVLCVTPAQALDPSRPLGNYVHDAWLAEDGLPQNSVLSMVQTRSGYLWLGTEEGVVRFDGLRFRVFDKSTTPELRNNFISALLEDSRGDLWIAPFTSALLRYRDGRFTAFGENDGLPRANVRCLLEAPAGTLWIGTEGGGLVRLRDGRFTTFTVKDGLTSDIVRRLAADRNGDLWIAGPGTGLTRLREGRFTQLGRAEGLPDAPVMALHGDTHGNIWVGTGDGLLLLRGGSLVARYAARQGLPRQVVTALASDSEGAVWIGFDGGGVARLWQGSVATIPDAAPLATAIVRSFVEDREGNMWVGTQAGGLHRLKDGPIRMLGSSSGLASEFVRAVRQTRDGALWVGTHGGGLTRIGTDGRAITYTTRDGLSSNTVWSLAETGDGALWMGTNGGGICRHLAGRFDCFGTRHGLGNAVVRAVYADHRGSLWIGTEGGGLQRFDGRSFTTYTTRDGLPNNVVRAIHEDRAGHLWLGLLGGAARLKDGRVETFGKGAGLPDASVFSFHEDADGVLWLGTYGAGLVRFKDGRFAAVTSAQGLYDDVAYTILEDAQGWLWMSSNKGIFAARRADLHAAADGGARIVSRVFGRSEGMKSAECNGGTQSSGFQGPDGRLYFSTLGGVAVLEPDRVVARSRPPQLVIEGALIDGRRYEGVGRAQAPPGRGSLELQFTGINLTAPEKVRFRYRLEGFDADWVDAGERRAAYYTNLPSGDYRFVVTAAAGDGPWNPEPAVFSFRLDPHLYEATWFRVSALLLVAAAAWALYRVRLHQVRRREEARIRELEAHEAELARRVDQALARVRILSGMLPICAWCKKVRDDSGYWSQIETYIREHSQADFTHGICPDCRDRMTSEPA